ncbi:MAG TPA: nucleotidyltransferase family protein [Thermoanaerobaculia bacterium]
MSAPRIAAVVLAAGGSTRMRRPKALLQLDGESFVLRVARVAGEAGFSPVVVVAGEEIGAIREAVAPVRAVENVEWREGLASSIRAGIASVAAECDAALLLLADQPLVSAAHLRELARAFADGSDPVATAYGRRRGVPAIFGSRWFDELRALTGDRGARDLLEREAARTFGDGDPPFDVDTPEDYERLRKR